MRDRCFQSMAEAHEHVLLAQQGNEKSRELVVKAFMPLVKRIIRTLHVRRRHVEDVRQEAVIGLLKAIDRFDARRNQTFSNYAKLWIRAMVLAHFKHQPIVHVGGSRRGKAMWNLGKLKDEDIAIKKNLSVADVQEVRAAFAVPEQFGEHEHRHHDPTAEIDQRLMVRATLKALGDVPERLRGILLERAQGASLGDVATRECVSRERVRQLEDLAIQQVRNSLVPPRYRVERYSPRAPAEGTLSSW